jgi:hypothetical protein
MELIKDQHKSPALLRYADRITENRFDSNGGFNLAGGIADARYVPVIFFLRDSRGDGMGLDIRDTHRVGLFTPLVYPALLRLVHLFRYPIQSIPSFIPRILTHLPPWILGISSYPLCHIPPPTSTVPYLSWDYI